jgi:hypothetical protein
MVSIINAIAAVIIFGISQAIVGVVWGIRLEGRTDVLTQRHDDLVERLEQKEHDLDKRLGQKDGDLDKLMTVRFDALDQRLERIERSMNGFLHRE